MDKNEAMCLWRNAHRDASMTVEERRSAAVDAARRVIRPWDVEMCEAFCAAAELPNVPEEFMTIDEPKGACIFDNQISRAREVWQEGKLLATITADAIEMGQKIKATVWSGGIGLELFGAPVKFEPGMLHAGTADALPFGVRVLVSKTAG